PNNRSWRFQERQLELYVYPKLGSRAVSSLKRRDVIDLIDEIAMKGREADEDANSKADEKAAKRRLGGSTAADNVLRVLRSVLNWAVSKDKL
ncbi:hypothetical protein, partial [Stenotrophomonas maltophilia]